jgi:hypothetical protein
MKSYKQFITEKHSSVLYHSTSVYNAKQIIENKKLAGSPIKGFELDHIIRALNIDKDRFVKMGYTNYISFARTPYNSFTKGILSNNAACVVFKFSGRAISNLGKIIPIDYAPGLRSKGVSENEDRLLIKSASIDMNNYIDDIAIVGIDTYFSGVSFPSGTKNFAVHITDKWNEKKDALTSYKKFMRFRF